MQHVPQAHKPVETTSPKEIRRKRALVKSIIEMQYGEGREGFYIADAIRKNGKEEREQLLKEMGLTCEIATEEGIAMMVDTGATWTLLRKWRQWLSKFGIKCASEKAMREEIEDWDIGDDITAENVPFLISSDKKKGDVMKKRHMAYVIDLKQHVLRRLDYLAE